SGRIGNMAIGPPSQFQFDHRHCKAPGIEDRSLTGLPTSSMEMIDGTKNPDFLHQSDVTRAHCPLDA
ncbi:MAG: hypothetical protein ACR2Q4_02430, partial [Geminicoccaceae bacterium]